MDEDEFLKRLFSRPEIHAGSRSLAGILGFLAGYAYARAELGRPAERLNDVFEAVRLDFSQRAGLEPENALTIAQLLDRLCGNDEAAALQLLQQAVERAMR